jgi:hypothetical protein
VLYDAPERSRGRGSMAELQLPKLTVRVRFPSPAPLSTGLDTDDHLRNHSAFWNGRRLSLTPAYDLAPVQRNTSVASHAIGLTRSEHHSQLRFCVEAAPEFHVTRKDAQTIIDHVVTTIQQEWNGVCDEARLTQGERVMLYGREFLTPTSSTTRRSRSCATSLSAWPSLRGAHVRATVDLDVVV